MSHPPSFSRSEDRGSTLPESDIIQAYAFDDSAASKQPPSYATEEERPFFGDTSVSSADVPNPAPPMAVDQVGGLAQPTGVPVSAAEDPLVSASSSARRVRWGVDELPSRGTTKIHLRPGGRGPTVSVKRPAAAPEPQPEPQPEPTPTGTTGIKRQNHPGQISLAGLAPPNIGQTEAIPMQPLDGASGHTGAMGLDGEDNDRFLALSRELNDLDEEDEAEDVAAGQATISNAAFPPGEEPAQHDTRSEDEMLNELRSGPLTPGTPGSTTDSSFDPAESLDHVDIIEGETDGMPSRPKRSSRLRRRKNKGRWAQVRNLIGIDSSSNETVDMMERGEVGAGATNMKSVPVETSTGLRGAYGRHRPSALERKAAKLVRAHKMVGAGGKGNAPPSELDGVRRDHLPGSEASTPDALDTAQNLDARPVAGGGVLGQLLQLYEQQRQEQASEHSATGDTPSATTDADLGGGVTLRNGRVVDAYGNEANVHELDPGLLRQGTSEPDTPHKTPGGTHYYSSGRPVSMTSPSAGLGGFATSNMGHVGKFGQKVVKGVAAEAGIDVMDERPKAARSSAGTIGALIATTGNLIGAVSPNLAQLGPNPKRPGYTLDRYLLPEMNEKTLKRTAKIVRDAAPVPKSQRPSLTPGGPRTPGVWTPGGMTSRSADDSFNPYFAAVTPNEKSGSMSIASSKPHSRFGSDTMSSASHRVSQIGHAGKNMFSRSLRPVPGSAGSDSANGGGDYFGNAMTDEEIAKQEWRRKLRKRKAKSKKQEIYITMHVAAILKRQEFLMKFARAMMMFGAPTHRIETQMQQTANVLDVNCRCIYLPNLMLLSFGDDATHTSDTKFIKQGSVLDLTKLTDMHTIYWNVIHDKIGVERASKQLDSLMRRRPYLRKWQQTIIGGFASFFITFGQVGFGGSLLDACAAFLLGAFLVFCQMSIKSELYSNVFEIVFATLNSFIAMALHIIPDGGKDSKPWRGELFCYRPIISGSIVLILPGFIVLTGALELQSKSLVSGSVRLVYAIIYSVMLGIGIKFGTTPLSAVRYNQMHDPNYQGQKANFDPLHCRGQGDSDNNFKPRHWYTTKASPWFAFLTVLGYSVMLSLRNQAKVTRKEFPVMVLIACGGWLVANYSQLMDKGDISPVLTNQISLVAAMGSFTVGMLANLYGRFFDGRSFVVAVPGILYQLPSGLSGNGASFITSFTTYSNGTSSGVSEVSDGLSIGEQLLNVSLGIAIGLFCATIVMHFLGGRRVRGHGMFSF